MSAFNYVKLGLRPVDFVDRSVRSPLSVFVGEYLAGCNKLPVQSVGGLITTTRVFLLLFSFFFFCFSKGKLTFKNGSTYEGPWKNDVRQGEEGKSCECARTDSSGASSLYRRRRHRQREVYFTLVMLER